jgi:hypothetical protein
MKIEQLKTKITEHTNKITELRNQMMAELRKDFHVALVELFDEYPFVNAVHFTAYTPYFNDGEECTFSCHQDDCGFNGYNSYDDEKSKCVSNAFGDIEGEDIHKNSRETSFVKGENGKWGNATNSNFNELHKKAVDDFRSALNAVSDENWQELVGDHCIVMIDRKGIHVKEYNHD